MKKGRIHSIETMGTVDGPGIRYVLFMQGCPLRCIYCHNRDSWDVNAGREVSSDEIFSEIKSFIPFMKASGGGITATGGEPLLQPEFLTDLFIKVKSVSLNTVLDTSGFADLKSVKKLIDVTDLVILSIKHVDNIKHKHISGADNIKIIEFINYLKIIKKPVWIRYVIIPGYTDSDDDINSLIKFLLHYDIIELVEILPYHTLGEFKWENMGIDYPLKGILPPQMEKMKIIKQKIADSGLPINMD